MRYRPTPNWFSSPSHSGCAHSRSEVWSAGVRGPGTEAAARKALKAQQREENERNRQAKEARRGNSSVHERDSTGTPIRHRLMPVYLLEFCAHPHGVSCVPRQCRTDVAHRVFEGLTCTGVSRGASQETRQGRRSYFTAPLLGGPGRRFRRRSGCWRGPRVSGRSGACTPRRSRPRRSRPRSGPR